MLWSILAVLGALSIATVGGVEGAKLYVTNPNDSPAPARTCGPTCNLRTAFMLARSGDTILIETNPEMNAPLERTDDLNFTISGIYHGGLEKAVIKSSDYANGFLSLTNLGPDYQITLENLIIEGFNGSNSIIVFATPTTRPHLSLRTTDADRPDLAQRRLAGSGVGRAMSSSVSITNCEFRSNVVSKIFKNMIYIGGASRLTIDNSDFTGNDMFAGSAALIDFWVLGGVGGGSVVARNSRFLRNNCLVFIDGEFATTHIQGCTFQGNTIYHALHSYNMDIDSSTFTGNVVQRDALFSNFWGYFNASGVVADLPQGVGVVNVQNSTELAFDACTFTATDGSNVDLVTYANKGPGIEKIFNRNPGSLLLNRVTAIQRCSADQFDGPYPCAPTGQSCLGVNNPDGREVGYICTF